MKRILLTACLGLIMSLLLVLPAVCNAEENDEAPEVTIENPTEGYFHFSGIKLFKTPLDVIGDTMGFGGFRLRPIKVTVEDDIDESKDLVVTMFVDDEEKGPMNWNEEEELFELKWIGPALGTFTLTIEAEDSSENVGTAEMEVWYFCFIPE
jgi:hypothetical protein